MPAGEVGRCALGSTITTCRDLHVRRKVPPLATRSGDDRECPECGKPMSVNIGRRGMRFVWSCGGGCDEHEIRALLAGKLGIDETCLGNYGKRKRATADLDARSRPDSAVYAAARKYFAIEKVLKLGLEPIAQRACLQAIMEGDGDLPPRPEVLLPCDYKSLAALARRAGVARTYSYQWAAEWLAKQAAA